MTRRFFGPFVVAAAIAGLLMATVVLSGRAGAELPVPTGQAGDPVAVRQKAQEILDRPEYRPPEKTLGQEIQERIFEWIGRTINTLAGGGGGSVFGWVIIVVLIAVVAFFAIRIGRGVQRSAQQPAEVVVEVRRSPTEWRAEAARFEAEGQWKEALRCRYRAMVTDLVARKVVPDIPGRTVGEHRSDVSSAVPAAATPFNGAAELFEQAWYGDRPTGQDENARFRAMSERVVQEVDR